MEERNEVMKGLKDDESNEEAPFKANIEIKKISLFARNKIKKAMSENKSLEGKLTGGSGIFSYSQKFTDEESATVVKEYFEKLKEENKYTFEIEFNSNKPLTKETKNESKDEFNYDIYLRKDNKSALKKALPDVTRVSPSGHMKLHDASVNAYEKSGYLSLFKYDLNRKATLDLSPPIDTVSGFKYTYNYLIGNHIHVLFIPKSVEILNLSDNPAHEYYVRANQYVKDRDRKPVLLNTDNVNKLSKVFDDGQERNDESRNLHENEFLYCGNWAQGMLEVSLDRDQALSFFNGRKSAAQLFKEFKEAGLLTEAGLLRKKLKADKKNNKKARREDRNYSVDDSTEKDKSAEDKVDDSMDDKRERKKARVDEAEDKKEENKEDNREGQIGELTDLSLNKELGDNNAQLQEHDPMNVTLAPNEFHEAPPTKVSSKDENAPSVSDSHDEVMKKLKLNSFTEHERQKRYSLPNYGNYPSTHRKQFNSPSTAIPNLLSLKKIDSPKPSPYPKPQQNNQEDVTEKVVQKRKSTETAEEKAKNVEESSNNHKPRTPFDIPQLRPKDT